MFRSATAFLPETIESTAPSQGKTKTKASFPRDDALGAEAILAQLSTWAQEKDGSPLNVAVVGLTNVSFFTQPHHFPIHDLLAPVLSLLTFLFC